MDNGRKTIISNKYILTDVRGRGYILLTRIVYHYRTLLKIAALAWIVCLFIEIVEFALNIKFSDQMVANTNKCYILMYVYKLCDTSALRDVVVKYVSTMLSASITLCTLTYTLTIFIFNNERIAGQKKINLFMIDADDHKRLANGELEVKPKYNNMNRESFFLFSHYNRWVICVSPFIIWVCAICSSYLLLMVSFFIMIVCTLLELQTCLCCVLSRTSLMYDLSLHLLYVMCGWSCAEHSLRGISDKITMSIGREKFKPIFFLKINNINEKEEKNNQKVKTQYYRTKTVDVLQSMCESAKDSYDVNQINECIERVFCGINGIGKIWCSKTENKDLHLLYYFNYFEVFRHYNLHICKIYSNIELHNHVEFIAKISGNAITELSEVDGKQIIIEGILYSLSGIVCGINAYSDVQDILEVITSVEYLLQTCSYFQESDENKIIADRIFVSLILIVLLREEVNFSMFKGRETVDTNKYIRTLMKVLDYQIFKHVENIEVEEEVGSYAQFIWSKAAYCEIIDNIINAWGYLEHINVNNARKYLDSIKQDIVNMSINSESVLYKYTRSRCGEIAKHYFS